LWAVFKLGLAQLKKKSKPNYLTDPLEAGWGNHKVTLLLAVFPIESGIARFTCAKRYARATLPPHPHWHYVKDISSFADHCAPNACTINEENPMKLQALKRGPQVRRLESRVRAQLV